MAADVGDGSLLPNALVVMGVAGSGKSTVGRLLATRLGLPFVDGDALHAPTAIDRMRRGEPLDDTDREPWLEAIGAQLDDWRRRGERGVIACSALKRRYRDRLRHDRNLRFIYLHGSEALLRQRLHDRLDHFMPESLLTSQLTDLEVPSPDEAAIHVGVDAEPALVVGAIERQLTL